MTSVAAGAPPLCHSPRMSDVIFREATRADLPTVLDLLADDRLGRTREVGQVDARYEQAFAEITADPRNQFVVAEAGGEVLGCMQLTYIPGLSRHGAERQLIESVRVRSDQRGRGLGRQLMAWAVDQARARGCALVQLTTDKSRHEAHRFYLGLGFVASHEGMKLPL